MPTLFKVKTKEGTVEEISVGFKFLGLGGLIYLAFGLLYHLMFMEAETFMWTDPWLFVGLFLWPFLLFARFFVVCVVLCAIGVACILLYDWLTKVKRRRQARRAHRRSFMGD